MRQVEVSSLCRSPRLGPSKYCPSRSRPPTDKDSRVRRSISIWRWQRSKIPSDVKNGAPRPKTWGTPVAVWDGATCDTRTFFKWQMLTFDITMCGDWAGIQSVFQDSWQSGSCYPKYATCAHANADPAALSEAYFEINYIKGERLVSSYSLVRAALTGRVFCSAE